MHTLSIPLIYILKKKRRGEDTMQTGQATMKLDLLLEDLILSTATKEQNCSKEELYFALNCLLRSFHTIVTSDDTYESLYTKTQFCTAYNILTGKTIYSFN